MAFSLSLTPRKFTKLLKPVMKQLCSLGLTIANYLDDLFQAERTYQKCLRAMYIVRDLLCTLGFIPNDKKSVYKSTQVLEMFYHKFDNNEIVPT